MTAIFMVWNSSGLAIASDKSVTASEKDTEGNHKVLFNDYASKLFKSRTKNFAVGIAGNSTLNGVPIQGIISQWEKSNEIRNSLLDYAEDFLKWFALNSMLENVHSEDFNSFEYVKGSIKYLIDKIQDSETAEPEIEQTINRVITDWEESNPPNIYGFSPLKFETKYAANSSIDDDAQICIDFCKRFADFRLPEEFYGYYLNDLELLVKSSFAEVTGEQLDESIKWHQLLKDKMIKFLIDHVSGNFNSTDLLFVGYGETDWLPFSVKISIYNFDQLLPWAVVKKVTSPNAVWYQSLGQYSTVSNFWDPISSSVKSELFESLQDKFGKRAYLEKVMTEIDTIISSHEGDLLNPIREKIKLLNVEKLAFIAQQMVSLESFNSFIREYLPTVGGEIDCIKITRVDNEFS
jgi:hypothetical protein